MRMRMVKSAEEIAVIRQSARAADMAGFAIRDAMKEGIMEYELTQIGVQVITNYLSLADACINNCIIRYVLTVILQTF